MVSRGVNGIERDSEFECGSVRPGVSRESTGWSLRDMVYGIKVC